MGTAADRTVRVLTAGTIAVALAVVGCGPCAAALPAGFPNLDSFASVPVDNYIGTGPKGPKRFVSFSTLYNIECNFVATTDPVPAGDSQGIICDATYPVWHRVLRRRNRVRSARWVTRVPRRASASNVS